MIVFTKEDLKEVVDAYLQFDEFCVDVETVGDTRLIPQLNEVMWIQLAGPGRADVIPMGHPNGNTLISRARKKKNPDTPGGWDKFPAVWSEPPKQLTPAEVFEALEPLFFSTRLKIGQNITFDILSCSKYYGRLIPGPYGEIIHAQWMLDENILDKRLAALMKRHFRYEMDKTVGKKIEDFSFAEASQYCYLDAKTEYLLWKLLEPQVIAENPEQLIKLERQVFEGPVMEMQYYGVDVDVSKVRKLAEDLATEKARLEAEIYSAVGRPFTLTSDEELREAFFKTLKLRPREWTAGGKDGLNKKPSVSQRAIEYYEDHPVIGNYLEWAKIDKLYSTYVLSYLGTDEFSSKIINGKIHGSFIPWGTVTGRFSCVSGDTLLSTSRGTFRFDSYIPQYGDLVPTHKGSWKPVVRKIYKGIDIMYRVVLYNGAEIKCTQDHRVFTPSGWRRVGDLNINDKVISDVNFKEIYTKSGECRFRPQLVPGGRQANHRASSREVGNHLSQCSWCFKNTPRARGLESRAEVEVLSFQTKRKEPYAGQEWFPAPPLQGSYFSQRRVSANQSGRELSLTPPQGNGTSLGIGETSTLVGRSSYRREQDEQRTGQFGVGDEGGAREASFQEIGIREIEPLGTMGVWDIEVEGDHSYVTHGFLNHNSREPNLQNVPAPGNPLGKAVRSIFTAPSGFKFVVADYGQVELLILAHYCRDPKLIQGFHDGVDAHTTTASMIFNVPPSEVTSEMRKVAKALNFAVVYGAGKKKVAQMTGTNMVEAELFLSRHAREFPTIYSFKQKVISETRRREPPHLTTILGRKRRLPTINSSEDDLRMYAERQAFNSLIQGSSADIIKLAMIRAYNTLDDDMRLVLTVHDELVTLVPEEKAERGKEIISEAMVGEGISKLLRVPLKADIKIVQSWDEAK